MQNFNTKKHLDVIFGLLFILMSLSAIGAVLCFIAMISGEGALPFVICIVLAICSYFGTVIISVIIDFYDAIVTKHKLETAILNAIDEDDKNIINSQNQ